MTTTMQNIRLAERMSRLGTESAFDVLVRAREIEATGKEVIHLEIGEPDFPTAPHIVEAGAKALRDGWTHYGPPAGLPQLREAIAEDVATRRGIKVDPSEVVVTPGAKPIMFYTILALVEPNDEVLCPNPGYPIYESMVNFIGARPVSYPLPESSDFDLDVNEIISKITERTRLLIMNSPHNPTGGVLSPSQIKALAEALDSPKGRDIVILTDEIYNRLIFEGEHASLTKFYGMKERTILLDGFSKTFAMTGWRLGYGVMPVPLAKQVAQLMTNSNSCTASFTQIAGIAALRGDQSPVDAMRAEFKRRRDVIVDGLNSIRGFRCRKPHGAFYAYPNITGTGKSSHELADALLNEAGVACLSGTAFGTWGEGFLRFSYANSIENISKALDRIKGWTKKNL